MKYFLFYLFGKKIVNYDQNNKFVWYVYKNQILLHKITTI